MPTPTNGDNFENFVVNRSAKLNCTYLEFKGKGVCADLVSNYLNNIFFQIVQRYVLYFWIRRIWASKPKWPYLCRQGWGMGSSLYKFSSDAAPTDLLMASKVILLYCLPTCFSYHTCSSTLCPTLHSHQCPSHMAKW